MLGVFGSGGEADSEAARVGPARGEKADFQGYGPESYRSMVGHDENIISSQAGRNEQISCSESCTEHQWRDWLPPARARCGIRRLPVAAEAISSKQPSHLLAK